MSSAVIANALLVLPDQVLTGGIVVENGLIAEIFEGDHLPAGASDWQGDFLAPGLIELHTDNLEHHLLPRPGVEWPRQQAILAHDAQLAGCGITTVFDALRIGSLRKTEYARPYARDVALEINRLQSLGVMRINHHLHLRAEICSETLSEELAAFSPEDQIGLVSMMDHTPGQRQFRDQRQYARYFKGPRGIDEDAFEAHMAMMLAVGAEYGPKHEADIVRVAALLGAVLASHDDTTLENVAQSAAYGVKLAEFPTTAEAAQACRENAILIMMGAPNLIRGGSHSGNIAARDLAEDGLLDVLSSDYVPASLLSGAMMLADLWNDLPRAIACVTSRPAQAVGLADRGRIEAGLRADMVRFRRMDTAAVLKETWVGGRRVA